MSLSLKATQADGYYQPPEFDAARHGTLNKINKTHRLGRKAKKIHQGIVTVRFEMPFKVWCLGCEQIIAKGVRFDAEKQTVGHFHSTPILEFSMTCLRCRHPLKIRSDPENTEYRCHEGCRVRVETFDPEKIGGWKFKSIEELKELEANPLLQAQERVSDAVKTRDEHQRLRSIMRINEEVWADDSAQNAALRKANRERRGVLPTPGDTNFILPEVPLTAEEEADAAQAFRAAESRRKKAPATASSQARRLRKLIKRAAAT